MDEQQIDQIKRAVDLIEGVISAAKYRARRQGDPYSYRVNTEEFSELNIAVSHINGALSTLPKQQPARRE
jgi:hypothetical protein